MKIEETITEDYIIFDFKKDGYHHFITVDYDDNVKRERVGGEGRIDVQVYEEEKQNWLEIRDEVLEKMARIRILYEEMFSIPKILSDVNALKRGFPLNDSLDDRLYNLADSIDIDDVQIAYDVYRIPYHVLKKYEEKIER